MLSSYTERIIGRLREEGLKVTPQRIAIIKHLDGNTVHPAVDDIYREVSRDFPTLSLATVYNTLDTLERIGEVRAICADPNRKHYDPNTSLHHHAICSRCNAIRDVTADYSTALKLPAEVAEVFAVEEAFAYFRGVCEGCSSLAA